MILNERSIQRLEGVHPDLVSVIYRAAELMAEDGVDFVVTEGVRTLEKQKAYVAKGASKTMRSRHIPEMNQNGQGCAVDLAVRIDGEVRWDWPLYDKLADIVKEAAHSEGVPIEWGGDWLKFKDGPHFQLPWSKYP